MQNVLVCDDDEAILESVSYTHLDVYKRQPNTCKSNEAPFEILRMIDR